MIKLHRIGVVTDATCPMCSLCYESVEHIFFQCPYSQQCLQCLQKWLGVHLPIDFHKLARKNRRTSKYKKAFIITCICSLAYLIWKARNDSIWRLSMSTVDCLMKQLIYDVKISFSSLFPLESCKTWFIELFVE